MKDSISDQEIEIPRSVGVLYVSQLIQKPSKAQKLNFNCGNTLFRKKLTESPLLPQILTFFKVRKM